MNAHAGSTARSEELFARAQRVIPGGVNSPVRAFRSVGGTPRFLARGEGPYVWDADGNRYVDHVLSWGPLVHGHAHPDVLAAAAEALQRGSSFGAPTELEVRFAEHVCARVPGVERIRCTSSGTEAAMSALRLARGVTGRDKIVKFAGHYHGHSDSLLASAGSGVLTLGLPDSPGVTKGAAADTIVLPWNDVDAVDELFASSGGDVAVLACEPVAANMGLVPPAPGFLEHLREVTRRHGALLLFDEVITGFRLGPAGAVGWSGVQPDLVAFGKIVGGGFPLAAFGGPAQVMDQLAPTGPVYQAGTLSGNPVAVAAGLRTLELLDEGAYEVLEARADRLAAGLREAFAQAGVPARVPQVRSLLGLWFAEDDVRDHAGAKAADHARYALFFHGMLERGVLLPPSGYEAIFLSTAHTEAHVDEVVAAAADVALALLVG